MDWPTDYAACFTQVFSSASKTLVAQDLAKCRDTHKKFLKSHFLTIVTPSFFVAFGGLAGFFMTFGSLALAGFFITIIGGGNKGCRTRDVILSSLAISMRFVSSGVATVPFMVIAAPGCTMPLPCPLGGPPLFKCSRYNGSALSCSQPAQWSQRHAPS